MKLGGMEQIEAAAFSGRENSREWIISRYFCLSSVCLKPCCMVVGYMDIWQWPHTGLKQLNLCTV